MFKAITEYLKENNIIGIPSISKLGNISVVIPNYSQDGETNYFGSKNPNDILSELTPLVPESLSIELMPPSYQYKGQSLIIRESSDITEFAFDKLEKSLNAK
tara:strand:+ start:363 stop:668 length:306 start_codon:yes stop_codon:yes gene_type:complete